MHTSVSDAAKIACAGCKEVIRLSWKDIGKNGLECGECGLAIDWSKYMDLLVKARARNEATNKQNAAIRREKAAGAWKKVTSAAKAVDGKLESAFKIGRGAATEYRKIAKSRKAKQAGGSCPRCSSENISSRVKASGGGWIVLLIGILMCLTIVGAIIGVPLIFISSTFRSRRGLCADCNWQWALPT